MSRRQEIVDALKIRFAGISVAAGYSSDLGESVHEWRDSDLERKGLPGMIFRDTASPVDNGVRDALGHRLQVEIEVITQGTAPAAAVRGMLQDVLTAVGVDPTWGGLADNTVVEEVDMLVVGGGNRLDGGGRIVLAIPYWTGDWEI